MARRRHYRTGLGLSIDAPTALPSSSSRSSSGGGSDFASFPSTPSTPTPLAPGVRPIADVEADIAVLNGRFTMLTAPSGPCGGAGNCHVRPAQMGEQGPIPCAPDGSGADVFSPTHGVFDLPLIADCVAALTQLAGLSVGTSMEDRLAYIDSVHRYASVLLDATNLTAIGPNGVGTLDENWGWTPFTYRGYGRVMGPLDFIFDWLEDGNGGSLVNRTAYRDVNTAWAAPPARVGDDPYAGAPSPLTSATLPSAGQRGWVQGHAGVIMPSVLARFADSTYRMMVHSAVGLDPGMSIADPRQISSSWGNANVMLAPTPMANRPGLANRASYSNLQSSHDQMQGFLQHTWDAKSQSWKNTHGFRSIMEMTADTDVLVDYYADITQFPGFDLSAAGFDPHQWGGLPAWFYCCSLDSFGNRFNDHRMMWASGYIYSGARMVRIAQDIARQLSAFKMGDYMSSMMTDYLAYLKQFADAGIVNLPNAALAAAQQATLNARTHFNDFNTEMATIGSVTTAVATAINPIIGGVVALFMTGLTTLFTAFHRTVVWIPVPMMKRNSNTPGCDTTGTTVGAGTVATNVLAPFIKAATTQGPSDGGAPPPPPPSRGSKAPWIVGGIVGGALVLALLFRRS